MATSQTTVTVPDDKAKKSTNFSMSITSDEAKDMHCEECMEHSSDYKPADGFCADCEEFKCSMCLEYHRRHYKNHSLQNKVSMPQDFFFEKCLTHPTLFIKFYCDQCKTVACSECKSHSHHNCVKVKHLPTLAQGTQHSKELKDLKQNIEELTKDEEKMKTQIKNKCEMADSMEAKSKSTITKHKDKLISTYMEQQTEIIGEFDKRFEETVARLQNERDQLVKNLAQKKQNFEKRICDSEQSILNEVKNSNTRLESLKEDNTNLSISLKGLAADLDYAQALGQNCKLFITMKDAENSWLRLRQNILDLQDYQLEFYDVEPLEESPSVESLDTTTSFFSYKELLTSATERVATFYKKIKLKSPCTSICLLQGNKLLAADNSNSLIHVVKDIHTNIQSYNMKMLSGPWGITKVEDNKVAVTFPTEGIVRLIRFSDSMTVISTNDIIVGEDCYGIVCCNNNLIVSYDTKSEKIQILDLSGNVLKCLDKDRKGQPLFSEPCYLTLSPDNTTIYVSDFDRHTVTSMTLDGKVNAIYRDDQLRAPYQLTVDDSGTVYVCGRWSNNVYQLSSELTIVKILLDVRQGMYYPVSVAYCQKNSRLYLGMGNSVIKVFNVSPEKELKTHNK